MGLRSWSIHLMIPWYGVKMNTSSYFSHMTNKIHFYNGETAHFAVMIPIINSPPAKTQTSAHSPSKHAPLMFLVPRKMYNTLYFPPHQTNFYQIPPFKLHLPSNENSIENHHHLKMNTKTETDQGNDSKKYFS